LGIVGISDGLTLKDFFTQVSPKPTDRSGTLPLLTDQKQVQIVRFCFFDPIRGPSAKDGAIVMDLGDSDESQNRYSGTSARGRSLDGVKGIRENDGRRV
jgi:hypothetical protein